MTEDKKVAECGALGFLAACGVWGDEFKRNALRNLTPTPIQ
jgi:hypothetical protein